MSDKLAYRKGKIGASDAPVIAGVSPWMTPLQLWEEKIGMRQQRSANAAMQRGIDKEEEARCFFEQEIGIIFFPQVLTHKNYQWMIASLDGLSIDENLAVEIKCPGDEDHRFVLETGEPPRKYYPQLQHQLAVSGLEFTYYFSFKSETDTAHVKVYRDDSYIQLLIDKELKFYECMQSFTPPESTSRYVEIRSDEQWKKIATEWKVCKKTLTELSDLESTLRKDLIYLCGEKSCSGSGVNVNRSTRKGQVDYNRIIEDYKIDLNKYRKQPTFSWKTSLLDD